MCSSDVTGKKYPSKKCIFGYDLKEAICRQRISLKSLPVEDCMKSWQPLLREKDIQVIFCTNMGKVVRCGSLNDDCCTKNYPRGALSCLFQDLKAFYGELWDTHFNQPLNEAPLLISHKYKLICNSHESVQEEEHRICSRRLHSIISTNSTKRNLIGKMKNKDQIEKKNGDVPLLSSALSIPTLITFGS